MKNSTQTQVILKSLDLELKSLLAQDLKNFKANKAGNTQGRIKQAA